MSAETLARAVLAARGIDPAGVDLTAYGRHAEDAGRTGRLLEPDVFRSAILQVGPPMQLSAPPPPSSPVGKSVGKSAGKPHLSHDPAPVQVHPAPVQGSLRGSLRATTKRNATPPDRRGELLVALSWGLTWRATLVLATVVGQLAATGVPAAGDGRRVVWISAFLAAGLALRLWYGRGWVGSAWRMAAAGVLCVASFALPATVAWAVGATLVLVVCDTVARTIARRRGAVRALLLGSTP